MSDIVSAPAGERSPWHPRRWLPTVIVAGLVLLPCSFYLAPDYGDPGRVFYLLVLLPILLLLPWCRSRALSLAPCAVYLLPAAWLALSVTWSADAGSGERSIWYLCKPLPMLAGLYLAQLAALARSARTAELLLQAVVLAAALSAGLSLARYLPPALHSGEWPRLAGISLRGDINVTAALFGANCLFCAWGVLHWCRRWRRVALASLLLSALVTVLSRSKVPLAGALLAVVWLLWEGRREVRLRRLLRVALPLALLLPVAYFLYFRRIPFLDRPEGYLFRLDLWSQALAQWAERPWLGHGLGSVLPLDLPLPGQPVFHSHAHSILLEMLRYGGLVGAALLLLQWLLGALWAYRLCAVERAFVPLFIWWVYGVLFLLTNGQQPLVKPHHVWFFYWLPLGFLLAGAARTGQATLSRRLPGAGRPRS